MYENGDRSQTESQIFPVCSSRLPPKSAPIIFYGPANTLKRVSVSPVWGGECKSGITMHVTSWEADFFVEDDKSTWHCRGSPHVQTARGINWIVISLSRWDCSEAGLHFQIMFTAFSSLLKLSLFIKIRICLFWPTPQEQQITPWCIQREKTLLGYGVSDVLLSQEREQAALRLVSPPRIPPSS